MSGAEKTEEESEAWQAGTADRINSSSSVWPGGPRTAGDGQRERELSQLSTCSAVTSVSTLHNQTRPELY